MTTINTTTARLAEPYFMRELDEARKMLADVEKACALLPEDQRWLLDAAREDASECVLAAESAVRRSAINNARVDLLNDTPALLRLLEQVTKGRPFRVWHDHGMIRVYANGGTRGDFVAVVGGFGFSDGAAIRQRQRKAREVRAMEVEINSAITQEVMSRMA